MVFQFLKNLEIPAANRANQKLLNLSIHTLQQLLMYHLKDLVLHQVWQVVPVRITKWKGCHIHVSGRYPLVVFLQLGRLSGVARSFVILNTYIYSGSSGVCTLHPAAHTRMTEVEALSIGPTVRLPSSITGAISRKFFHSRGFAPTPREGQSPWNEKTSVKWLQLYYYTTHYVMFFQLNSLKGTAIILTGYFTF